jgi:hypothetical protein
MMILGMCSLDDANVAKASMKAGWSLPKLVKINSTPLRAASSNNCQAEVTCVFEVFNSFGNVIWSLCCN